MPKTVEIDMTEYTAAVNRAYNMGTIRRRDIAAVFRNADRPLISAAKRLAPRGRKDVISNKYASRSHKRGNLRRGIGFVVSKKQKLVYWVRSKAWYTQIVVVGHGSYSGNPFMERAVNATESQVVMTIKDGLKSLLEKTWRNG